ncbi:MAG: hypothetical protein HYU56_03770 [Candidatus Aenigmarchaeota archaeon]|nr:hypothetical protein [Candidatus Aenigmarchaeota archaeon]
MIYTSHSIVFKQWFRECELLQSFGLCDTGKPLVYHVLKDSEISASHRLQTVVLDTQRNFY